jgi:D-alanine-D-alanine ligase-like ATP-grasp enzyme
MLPPSVDEFRQAFTQALQFGPVLIEAYAKGAAYRLFVQNQQVVAAMELTPANVVGDGRRSIAALVSHKNLRRPIAWQPVVLDEPAQAMLAAQGVTADQVVPRGHQVLLRATSNTRFGADGYDVTDDLDDGYKTLAVKAVQALGLDIAGVDMVIANLYRAYDPEKPGLADILSVTGTPAIWPHAVAQMGTKRDLATSLLTRMFN